METCRTLGGKIQWDFCQGESDVNSNCSTVASGMKVTKKMEQILEVNDRFDLTIKSASSSEAGIYKCLEIVTDTRRRTAQLIVSLWAEFNIDVLIAQDNWWDEMINCWWSHRFMMKTDGTTQCWKYFDVLMHLKVVGIIHNLFSIYTIHTPALVMEDEWEMTTPWR